VVRAGKLGERDRLGRHRPQKSDEVAGLLDRCERVERAVYDEARRHTVAHVAHRRRKIEDRELLLAHPLHDVTFERAAQRVSATADAVAVGEVEDGVHRDEGPHRRVGGFETRLEARVVGGEADHGAEMASGRAPGDDDPIRIAAVLGDVLLHPRQRALAVDEMVGPRRAR